MRRISDIICAAVSAIAYTAIGYFHEKQYDGKLPVYSERDGFLKFEAPRPSTDRAEERAAAAAVLEAARIGLMQIAQSYGTEYIRVID